MNWIRHSLSQQLLLTLGAGLALGSLLGLAVFIGLYYSQLTEERSHASEAVNRLLQSSLENAMLKQDLDGLRGIVRRLGQQRDIARVFIANPRGEVRFASDDGLLGQIYHWTGDQIPQQPGTHFLSIDGEEVLRSINPVRNKPPCIQCHGTLADNPINGVLFVDYAAAPIRAKAWTTAGVFVIAGLTIITLTSVILWLVIRHLVLLPVRRLDAVGQALGEGQWEARVLANSNNELGRLATTFNHMADALQAQMRAQQEQEAFLQALLDAIPDGIRVLDSDYRVLKVNRAYCAHLGIAAETALSQPCHQVYQRARPCAPTLSVCPLHEITQHSEPLKKLTHYLSANGTERPVEVFAAPMQVNINGQPQQLVVESIRDLEQAIQFSHEQKLAAMGQIAAGVAHEIHNPLASVRLALQNTLRLLESGSCDPPALRTYLNLVDREVDKCIDVTQRLLKLTTHNGGQLQLVPIENALRETLSLLEYESQERGIKLHVRSLAPINRVLARENDVRMIIMNLVQNAFHAMPDGGRLNIVIKNAAACVQLHFHDTGVGIAPEHLSKIFDPFFSYRADGKVGTGLGLSICRALAEQYQGKIQVRSRAAEGACFTLRLPAADQVVNSTATVECEDDAG